MNWLLNRAGQLLVNSSRGKNLVAFLFSVGLTFHNFQEGRIKFRPTYKYNLGTTDFDSSKKMRTPSYTVGWQLWFVGFFHQNELSFVMRKTVENFRPAVRHNYSFIVWLPILMYSLEAISALTLLQLFLHVCRWTVPHFTLMLLFFSLTFSSRRINMIQLQKMLH